MQTKTRPTYIRQILDAWARGEIDRTPGLQHIDVMHDDWCPKLHGGLCTCKPEIRVRPRVRDGR